MATIRSASLQYGVHPKRLRKLLFVAGHLDDMHLGASDGQVEFDGEAAAEFLELVAEEMSLIQAAAYLGAPRPHDRVLLEGGFIEPFIRSDGDLLKNHAFAKRHLDDFLDRLLAGTVVVDVAEEGWGSILQTARRVNRGAGVLIDLVLEGRAGEVRSLKGERSYLSLLFDIEKVKLIVEGEPLSGLTLRQVEKRMRTHTAAVKALIAQGALPASTAVNPVNLCPQTVVKEEDLEAFSRRWISLSMIEEETGVHFRRAKRKLEDAGVAPHFERKLVGATFYDRREALDAMASPSVAPGP